MLGLSPHRHQAGCSRDTSRRLRDAGPDAGSLRRIEPLARGTVRPVCRGIGNLRATRMKSGNAVLPPVSDNFTWIQAEHDPLRNRVVLRSLGFGCSTVMLRRRCSSAKMTQNDTNLGGCPLALARRRCTKHDDGLEMLELEAALVVPLEKPAAGLRVRCVGIFCCGCSR